MRRAAKVDATEIRAALQNAGSSAGAASLLGVSRATFSRWMAANGIRSADVIDRLGVSPGDRFGRWVIIDPVSGTTDLGHRRCTAKCDCGTVAERYLRSITSGATKSCGCDAGGAKNPNFRHGRHGSPEYRNWLAMNARCHNPNASNYHWYGGKGVEVCPEWRADFSAFLRDMGGRPSPQHTVDRVNPFLGYSPENCRWATPSEQMKNLRRHHAEGK